MRIRNPAFLFIDINRTYVYVALLFVHEVASFINWFLSIGLEVEAEGTKLLCIF
jgi:hypothetical protein